MLDANKIKTYIETKNHITLSCMQYQVLKAIIRGDIVYTARGIGRSLLYNGYADYLKEVVGSDTDRTVEPKDFDSVFTASMFMQDEMFIKNKVDKVWNTTKAASPERFNLEFECKYDR